MDEARNIKSKQTRKSVERGLGRILRLLGDVDVVSEGLVFFADGSDVVVESYGGRRRVYHCGREYLVVVSEAFPSTMLVVVDANEATIGATDGEHISVLWHENSMVPRKHRKGGQSQRRFERDRERALQQWLRHVVEQTQQLCHEGQEIRVGGPGMTKDKYAKEMPT